MCYSLNSDFCTRLVVRRLNKMKTEKLQGLHLKTIFRFKSFRIKTLFDFCVYF